MSSLIAYAVRYVERFGLKLVPLPPRSKGPVVYGWNTDAQLITTVAQVRERIAPFANIGVCLEPSGLCSLDADYLDGARTVLANERIDLDRLIAQFPTIRGRSPRLEFSLPPGFSPRHRRILWPPKPGEDESICVLELRGGRIQDVLPPSIHPKTNQPYVWITPPTHGFPVLPDEIRALWLDFDRFAHRARNACPWAPPEPEPVKRIPRVHTGVSPIALFNDAHSVTSILQAHGYQKQGKRFRSPGSETHAAGIRLLDDGRVCCYHWSDALGDGKPHDAFDLYCLFEHGGDVLGAVKAAANLLGLHRERQS